MEDYIVDISGVIDRWYINLSLIKDTLKKKKGCKAFVRVCSFGGDVNIALQLSSMFQSHGDVTVDYVGLNASSATLLSLGAKNVRMHEDSAYLIHKPMVWVNEWGMMNEDQIQEAMDSLEDQKKDAEFFTLLCAKMYARKCGKSVKSIIDLMKEEKWLSSEDALKMGFVDEVIPASKANKNMVKNSRQMVLNQMGIPSTPSNLVESDSFIKKFIAMITNTNKEEKIMNKTFITVMALLAVEALTEEKEGITLTLDQMKAVEDKLSELTSDKKKLEDDLLGAKEEIKERDTQIKNLKEKPGESTGSVAPTGKTGEPDDFTAAIAEAKKLYEGIN